jgi:hypothetical protein
MSVNGLLLGYLNGQGSTLHGGVQLQEVEAQIISNVDPYFSANLIVSLPSGGSVGIEEGYVSAIPLLAGVALRGGKIKSLFGRENSIHTHALPFIEKSLVGTAILGDEGLDGVGAEGTAMLPMPWYCLLAVNLMDGKDQVLLGSPADHALAGSALLRNVIDITDDSTLEVGLSYAGGKGVDQHLAQAAGAHLVFKWKPATDAMNSSAVVALEAIVARQPTTSPDGAHLVRTDTAGFYGYVQWQLSRRWYAGARFDYLDHPAVASDVTMRESAILVLAPTEFSAFRLQASVTEPPFGAVLEYGVFLQVNFTLGAHPAHAY